MIKNEQYIYKHRITNEYLSMSIANGIFNVKNVYDAAIFKYNGISDKDLSYKRVPLKKEIKNIREQKLKKLKWA